MMQTQTQELTEAGAVELLNAELDALFAGEPRADAPREATSEEDFVVAEHRTCKCAMTYVHRKRHGALGTAIQVRVCCMARALERLMGVPEGTFFGVIEFAPSWVWDCDHVAELEKTEPDGTKVLYRIRRGAPPEWLRQRMEAKGIPIVNMRPGVDDRPGFGYGRGPALGVSPLEQGAHASNG
jgi:hypothetical protein